VVHRSKVLVVLMVLALILAVAIPAVAQVTQAPTGTSVSGPNQNTGGSVTSTGDSSNTCSAQLNYNNSGSVLNQLSFLQYHSAIGNGNVFLSPSYFNLPSQTVPCEQTVQQAASSSSGPSAPLYTVPQ
jgi:hypothetical protein